MSSYMYTCPLRVNKTTNTTTGVTILGGDYFATSDAHILPSLYKVLIISLGVLVHGLRLHWSREKTKTRRWRLPERFGVSKDCVPNTKVPSKKQLSTKVLPARLGVVARLLQKSERVWSQNQDVNDGGCVLYCGWRRQHWISGFNHNVVALHHQLHATSGRRKKCFDHNCWHWPIEKCFVFFVTTNQPRHVFFRWYIWFLDAPQMLGFLSSTHWNGVLFVLRGKNKQKRETARSCVGSDRSSLL